MIATRAGGGDATLCRSDAVDAIVLTVGAVPAEADDRPRAAPTSKHVTVDAPFVVCRSPVPPVPRAQCHRHIDTVFVVVVLIAMLILVIAECVAMKRTPGRSK